MRTPEVSQWRELYRCEDLLQARAVAASIAAMEFDVRLHTPQPLSVEEDIEDASEQLSAFGHRLMDFPGPYIIEVPAQHLLELTEVLNEIISEQREFDEWLELRRTHGRKRLVVVLTITSVAEVLLVLKLIDT